MSATAVETAAEPLTTSLRQQIALVAPDQAGAAIETLLEAMKATKTGSGMCRKCGTRVEVLVQDANAATNALKLLIEQTEGRPGVAGDDAGQGVTISRVVVAGADATIRDALALMEQGEHEQALAALRAAVHEQPLDSRK